VIDAAVAYLAQESAAWPSTAIVLGSAQAGFLDHLKDPRVIMYSEIPGWPVPRVPGHAGRLAIGTVNGKQVVVLAGRVHYYEGWKIQEVTFGLRVLARLGLKSVVLTNAAGGINPNFDVGQLVLVTDHINLMGANPLTGPIDPSAGPRFVDMTAAYDAKYREAALSAATGLSIPLGQGVYAALSGPSFETPAEIRYLRTIGADLVGMSTVPEVIAMRHARVRVMAISTVTNKASGMQSEISHAEVLEIGWKSANQLFRLLERVLPGLE